MPHLRSRRSVAGDSAAINLLAIFVLALIVTAFALPEYRSYTLREHSKLARNVLEDVSGKHRLWREIHPSQRPLSLEDFGFPSSAIYVSSDGTANPSASINSIYRVSLSFPSANSEQSCGLLPDDVQTGFVLVAEPIQTQRIDTQCARLCLSSSGQQGISGDSSVEKCWGSH